MNTPDRGSESLQMRDYADRDERSVAVRMLGRKTVFKTTPGAPPAASAATKPGSAGRAPRLLARVAVPLAGIAAGAGLAFLWMT